MLFLPDTGTNVIQHGNSLLARNTLRLKRALATRLQQS